MKYIIGSKFAIDDILNPDMPEYINLYGIQIVSTEQSENHVY